MQGYTTEDVSCAQLLPPDSDVTLCDKYLFQNDKLKQSSRLQV